MLAYVWVHRFPMYQWDAENGRWHATHNPFSGVLPEDEALLVTASGDPARPSPEDPAGRARALQYDLALNGWELGGGSIRIHRRDLLERSFLLQGHSLEAMHEKFGAVLDAFEYGAPPHGGIALGIDRWAALFAHQTNIREVMAFPKTQSGTDLMLEAPSIPEPGQYEELGLRFVGAGKGQCRGKSTTRRRGRRSGAATPGPRLGSPRRPRLAAPARRGVHRVLGDLLPLRRGLAVDRHGLPGCLRAAASRRWWRSGSGAAMGRCRPTVGFAALAGVFFTGDLMFWHHAIEAVGPGSRRSSATSR